MNAVMSTPHHRAPRAGAVAALLLLLSLGLGACGGEDGETRADDPAASDSPTQTESTDSEPTESEDADPTESEDADPTEPVCSQVWTAGSVLPGRYQGCYDDAKQAWRDAEVYRCSSGQKLITYQRTFYAVPGEEVIETQGPLARDAAFQKALKTCGA